MLKYRMFAFYIERFTTFSPWRHFTEQKKNEKDRSLKYLKLFIIFGMFLHVHFNKSFH